MKFYYLIRYAQLNTVKEIHWRGLEEGGMGPFRIQEPFWRPVEVF